jgi:Tol biopolymer transport system component
MNTRDDFNVVISDWLDDQAGRGAPDYLDEILVRTTRTRQRPAWSSLERWLPMQTTLRFAPAPRIAWLLVVLALLAAAGVAVVVVGSHTRQLPPPFGLARNGTIIYGGSDHDIHRLDPVTGVAAALINGLPRDGAPSLSPDGTRFFFLRDSDISSGGGRVATIMVANVDGTNVRDVTGVLSNMHDPVWSHDGSHLAVALDVDASPRSTIRVFTVDGSKQPQVIDIGDMAAIYLAFRPGDRELTFRGVTSTAAGLYAIGADGHGLRTILTLREGDYASLSPDGTKIAYQVWDGTTGTIHVINVDTGADSIPSIDRGTTTGLIDDSPTWSPDGARLLFVRYHGAGGYRLAVVPATGGSVVEIGPSMPSNETRSLAQFSPDGMAVMAYFQADQSTWMLDPTGAAPDVQLPATIAEQASWQRLAP